MYDHYLFEKTDMSEALEQVNEEQLHIVSSFFLSDSNQVCLIVEKRNDLSTLKKFMDHKDEKENRA